MGPYGDHIPPPGRNTLVHFVEGSKRAKWFMHSMRCACKRNLRLALSLSHFTSHPLGVLYYPVTSSLEVLRSLRFLRGWKKKSQCTFRSGVGEDYRGLWVRFGFEVVRLRVWGVLVMSIGDWVCCSWGICSCVCVNRKGRGLG